MHNETNSKNALKNNPVRFSRFLCFVVYRTDKRKGVELNSGCEFLFLLPQL